MSPRESSSRESAAQPVPSYDLAAWRRRIPLLERYIVLNSCSRGPQLDSTRAAATYLDSWNEQGMDWPGWMAEVEAAKAEFASLIHAEPHDLAVTTSVSAAIKVVEVILGVSALAEVLQASP